VVHGHSYRDTRLVFGDDLQRATSHVDLLIVRIALVHDYLCTLGGSDRVFQYMCEAFPNADVFTLSLNRCRAIPYFAAKKDVRTTWMNPIVQTPGAFRALFPVATYAMQSLDLREYDLVLSSSATVAKYVRAPNGRHVCYCYIPTRALWHFDEYFGKSISGAAFKLLLPFLRRHELRAVSHIDEFIAISAMTQGYIREYYNRDSTVLHCPIDLSAFAPRADRHDAFLIVSRLEYWKRLDYAVAAFTRLGLPLRIIGQGPEESKLRALAGPNVTFLGAVDDKTLAEEYARARAVIFTPFLEYGLIPLEANASGTPVIAYGRGGIEETMVPVNRPGVDPSKATAVFFGEQTPDAVIEAVRLFQQSEFDPQALVRHASQWSVPEFQSKLKTALNRAP
jgi:glycosyltransferase involved in cell wall biosynthesis